MVRRGLVWGAGGAVVLTAVTTALVNELHGGWPWWVACGVTVIIWAVLAMWLASRDPTHSDRSLRVGVGGVFAGRDIRGVVRTRARLDHADTSSYKRDGWDVRPGGVAAGRDITSDVTTDVDSGTTTTDRS